MSVRVMNRGLLSLALLLASACGDDTDPTVDGGGDSGNPYADGAIPGDRPCDAELDFFRDSVWSPILSVQCAGCHNSEGTAQASEYILQEVSGDDELVANFHATARMAFETLADVPLLLLRPTNTHPMGHPGGELFPVGSLQYEALQEFIHKVTTDGCDEGPGAPACDEPVPGRRALRRLTHAEYGNTIRDLLGIDTNRAERFAPDTVVHGFDNNSGALNVNPLLADQYSATASAIADEAIMNPSWFIPSCEAGWSEERCAENFVRVFGERAFRRAVHDDDVTRYLRVYRLGAQSADFNSGIRWVLVAMLQSPSFLYRREVGAWDEGEGLYVLDDYEVASELSYLILASMPDEPLFAAARAGELRTPAQIMTHAQRLIALDGSRATVRRFVQRWLDLERLHTVPKDAETYPDITVELRQSMQGEVDRFVDHVVFEGEGSLSALLTADYTFVDDRLATLYGATPEGEADSAGFRRASLASEGRRGITTLGGYLFTHARPNSSSPVERGLVVRERLLCQDLPPPPPGIVAEPPPLDPMSTTRERYTLHSSVEPCRSCHRLVDPIGFSYEHFDGIGRWRMDDFGHPIDATGHITETENTNVTFDGNAELTGFLSMSPDVHDCFTLQWVRYGYGLTENGRLSCMVDELAAGFRDGSMSVTELVVALTQTPHFVSREGDAPGGTMMPMPDGGMPDGGVPDADLPPEDSGMPMTGPDPRLDVMVVTDDWGAGYCNEVTVTNTSMEIVDWAVTLDVEGTLQEGSPWNANADARSGRVGFTGVDWNRRIDPAGMASFGFCAVR